MFNLLTCTLPMTRGRCASSATDIAGLPQREVARLGLARTFQHVKLRPHMSLLDNVALGAHSRDAGRRAARRACDWTAREERQILQEAQRQLDAHRPGRSRARARRQPAARHAAHPGDRARAGRRPGAAGARRAGGRPAPQGKDGARRPAAQAAGGGRDDPHRRARHGLRDETGGPAGGDELRLQAGGGRARRGACRRARAGGLPRERRHDGDAGDRRPARLVRPGRCGARRLASPEAARSSR